MGPDQSAGNNPGQTQPPQTTSNPPVPVTAATPQPAPPAPQAGQATQPSAPAQPPQPVRPQLVQSRPAVTPVARPSVPSSPVAAANTNAPEVVAVPPAVGGSAAAAPQATSNTPLDTGSAPLDPGRVGADARPQPADPLMQRQAVPGNGAQAIPAASPTQSDPESKTASAATPVAGLRPSAPVQPVQAAADGDAPPQADTSSQGSQPPVPRPSGRSGLRGLLRTYWYVVVLVLIVVGGIVFWQVDHSRKEAAWTKATAYYEKAEYDRAAEALKGLGIPSDPDRLQVYSQTMLATRELDKALEGYQKLGEIKNDAPTKLVIGNIYNEQKKPDEAISVYKEIIASSPDYSQAYVNLASMYATQGKTSEALSTLDQGIAKISGNVTLHELKVSLLVNRKGSAEYTQAVEALRKVNPDDPLLRSIGE